MNKARFVFVTFCVVCAICVRSMGAQELSLDEAVSLALQNNVSFSAKKTSLEQAKRAAVFSWNAFMPNISLSGSISNTHPIKPKADPTESWSASGAASLQLTAAIPSRMKLAFVRLESEKETYREAEQALITTVSTSFYKLLADKANIAILRDNLALTNSQYEQTKRNYEHGLASELELLNAEYTYRMAGPALDDAVSAYEASLASYLLTLGLDAKSPRTPAGEITVTLLELPQADELSRRYLENRPDVKRARLAVETAKLTQTVDWLSNRAPSISLQENISLSPPATAKDPFDIKPDDITSRGQFSIGITIPITAWIPGSTQSLALKTDADAVGAAQKSLDETVKLAELDIQKKAVDVLQSAEKIDGAELRYRIARRAYELSEQGYRSGLVSQTSLLDARQTMITARQTALQTQITYTSAVYSLASALGLGIDEIIDLYGEKK